MRTYRPVTSFASVPMVASRARSLGLRSAHITITNDHRRSTQRHGNRQVSLVELDHIKEVKDGGAMFDPANLIFRCHHCHMRKTRAAAVDRKMMEFWQAKIDRDSQPTNKPGQEPG